MSDEWKRDRFAALERGQNPMVLARMRSGYAVIGDVQFLPGYCVLLAYPKAGSLNDLSLPERGDFLLDMSLLGDAIQAVCKPSKLNYSVYGNSDPFLHAHVFPRYESEPTDIKPFPVWAYGKDIWRRPESQYTDDKHGAMRQQIAEHLMARMKDAYS